MAEVSNVVLTTLINGLSYNEQAEEYTFNDNRYKIKGSQDKSSKQKNGVVVITSILYFVNISNPADLKTVTCVNDIPTFDGFNNIKINTKLRKLIYLKGYYKQVTLEKRQKARAKQKAKREQEKAKLKEQMAIEKEKAKAEKLARIQPKKCEHCGIEFVPKLSKQKFCCHDCQIKYNSKKQAKADTEKRHSEKICVICGKKFIGTPREKYCSSECYKIAQQENRRRRYERDKARENHNKDEKSKHKHIKNTINKTSYGRKIDW